MTKIIPITKVREELPAIIADAKNKLTEYVVTVNGEPAAVIMSHGEYESWKETNEILSDKELMREIRQAERELKRGKGIPWIKVKKNLGINV